MRSFLVVAYSLVHPWPPPRLKTACDGPANDTLGFGLFGRYRLNDRWLVGFGVDVATGYDVEEPEKLVGLVQDPSIDVIDANADSYTFMGWIEREYSRDTSKWSWFWTIGLGYSSVSVDDVQGPLEGGGTVRSRQRGHPVEVRWQ